MPDISRSTARALAATLGAAAALTLSGCNAVGPASLSAGRGVYNDVLNRTEDEQILSMIIRLRYGETFSMLSVASVTASISATATVSGNFGLGPDESFAGNLVPLGIQGVYEENPTISYIPLGGEKFVVALLSPLSLLEAFLITRAAPGDMIFLRTLVNRANGLVNPVTLGAEPDNGFTRVAAIVHDLTARRKMSVVGTVKDGVPQFSVLIYDYADHDIPLVKEYLGLLKLTDYDADGKDIRIPISAALGRADGASLNLELRSVFDLVVAAGRSIEVPEEHLERGIVKPPPPVFSDDTYSLRIRSSRSRPRDATVAVPYEGWWFYIDRADHASKEGYMLLRTLIGMRLNESDVSLKAPALTIGVGG